MKTITLNNGLEMPMQGFGVFQITDYEICEQAVMDAIAVGYRLIDTASIYMNERAVGAALRHSVVPREELFITTKPWITEMGYERTKQAFKESLDRLGLDYLDLYLIHMPFGDYYGAWRAMEELYTEGVVKAIGVCNFEPDRLIDLCSHAKVIPAVNQVEVHPFTQQKEAMQIMQSLGVQIEAWAPFAEGMHGLFTDERLVNIGKRQGKSAAQVVLRWLMQRGIVAIPKSVRKERMEQNIDVEDVVLTADDMKTIAAIDLGKSLILDLHAPKEVERLSNMDCNNK